MRIQIADFLRRIIASVDGKQHAEVNSNAPNRILVVQIGADAERGKVFKAHAAPLGLCDNLFNALKLFEPAERW